MATYHLCGSNLCFYDSYITKTKMSPYKEVNSKVIWKTFLSNSESQAQVNVLRLQVI